MPKRNREEEILEAAIKIFSEKGFSGATTSEIAKEAGVAEGTIFRYFKTKKDILKKVLFKLMSVIAEKFIVGRIEKILNDHQEEDPKEIMKLIMIDRICLLEEHEELMRVVLTEIQFHEDLREAFIQNIVTGGKNIVEEFIRSGVEKGFIRKDIEPVIIIRSLVGIVGMYIIQRQFIPDLIEIEEDKQMDILIDMLFNGIGTDRDKELGESM